MVAIFFIMLCVSVSIQVIARYFFNQTFSWAEEFPIFIFLWVSLTAAAVAYREGSHLSVDYFADKLPKKFQRPLMYINLALSFAFMAIVVYYETRMTISVRESTFVVMKMSKAWGYAGIPVSCILFLIFIVEKFILLIQSPSTDEARTPERIPE